MSILQAYLDLKRGVTEINKRVTDNQWISASKSNFLYITSKGETEKTEMESFTDTYVKERLKACPQADRLVFTDLASINTGGEEMTYFLYKAYHSALEQGLVFYQPVNKTSLEPLGDLQFSNPEQNIFFSPLAPDFEESSCNAVETKDSSTEHKKIVFLTGNMNEERLLFDIERLIITTIHNCLKHPKLHFHFIISLAKFGGEFSESFDAALSPVKKLSEALLADYPKITFTFEYTE